MAKNCVFCAFWLFLCLRLSTEISCFLHSLAKLVAKTKSQVSVEPVMDAYSLHFLLEIGIMYVLPCGVGQSKNMFLAKSRVMMNPR